ncbi:MAG TPA: T9SS type A sorting domain-containing protein, partial [Flavisolibacter sp.]
TFYRLALLTSNGARTQSHTIILHNNAEEFTVTNLINPFKQTLSFDVTTTSSSQIEVALLDASGHIIKRQKYPVALGINSLSLKEIPSLSGGMYILQVQQNGSIISRKVMKQ